MRNRGEYDEGGSSKDRCRDRKKAAIVQVFAYVYLRSRGEVAERLKAAVC